MAIALPAPRLRIVSPGALPARASFTVLGSKVRPREAFFDARPGVRLRYRFRSYGALDVTVKLVRRGRIVRTWAQKRRLPYIPHRLTWNGMRRHGDGAPRGHYRFMLKTRGHQRSPHPEVSPGRRQVPGPGATRLRRAGAEVRSSPQRRSHPPGPGRVRRLRHPCGRGAGRARPGARNGPRPVRRLGGDRRSRHTHRRPVRPLDPPGLGPRRRAGEDRRADRPHRQDRQRPHGRLHAALRGLALGLAPRRPRGPPPDAASLGPLRPSERSRRNKKGCLTPTRSSRAASS